MKKILNTLGVGINGVGVVFEVILLTVVVWPIVMVCNRIAKKKISKGQQKR